MESFDAEQSVGIFVSGKLPSFCFASFFAEAQAEARESDDVILYVALKPIITTVGKSVNITTF